MSRESANELDVATGFLLNGYDYENQAWVEDGKYQRCGHLASMVCRCYGRDHEGEVCTVSGN